MSAKPRVKCEKCGGPCQKLLGMGSGIIFKGGGFYETDFKDKKGVPPEKTEKATAASKDATKKESKDAGASDVKGASKDTSPVKT